MGVQSNKLAGLRKIGQICPENGWLQIGSHGFRYSLRKISDYLEIDTNFIFSSDIEKNNNLKAQDKILNICEKLNTTKYINVIGGEDLYDKDRFKKEGIKLNFLKAEVIEYKQYQDEFKSHLSIIDILMFNDADSVRAVLKSYSLV